MTFTKKEQGVLKEIQKEEKLCVEKYNKAAMAACDPQLKKMFSQIADCEQQHYDTVTQMLEGNLPQQKSQPGGKNAKQPTAQSLKSKAGRAGKKTDAYLLQDLLGTEKYVANVYNTAVFEFQDEKARQTLSGIQQQEQHHGKQLYDYLAANKMTQQV